MRKIKKHFTDLLMAQRKLFKIVSNAINMAAIIVLILWVLDKKLNFYGSEFDQEPVFTLLMLFSVAANRVYLWLLEEAEYSLSHALAVGYVSNFLSPVLTQLIQNGEKRPKIYIYKPSQIEELYRNNVDRLQGELRNKRFDLEIINLDIHDSRSRDILKVQKSKNKAVFFNFPNTLLSLQNYVDYKIESKSNRSSEKAKKELMEKLLKKFYEKVNELTEKENFDDKIFWCNKNLQLEF